MVKSRIEPETIADFHTMPGYLLRRMHQISTALFAEECAAFDLTPVQYAALVAIGLNPQVDATRLSSLISFDRSTIGDVLERIESKGWVKRTSSYADRRIKLLSLSTKGRKLIAEVTEPVLKVQERLLEPLGASDRTLLLQLLLRLTDAHQETSSVKA